MNEKDDLFFNTSPPLTNAVQLSHLNNKSSVLCTKNQNITEQYLVLQHLDAHQQMISRAKGIVDTSAPQSLQSYLSVMNQRKKSQWSSQSKLKHLNLNPSTSSVPVHSSEDEDNLSVNASSVNRAVQTGPSYLPESNKVADKISWYLEALSKGAAPFVFVEDPRYASSVSEKRSTSTGRQKKLASGDIVETHTNCFLRSKKPFSPRILANNTAKSKLKEMRCYNPPFRRRKKQGSVNSSDTFESYDSDEEEKEKEGEKNFENLSEDIETQVNKRPTAENVFDTNRLQNYLLNHNRKTFETIHPSGSLNRNEDKYLDFLSKVTEDILRSGIYSDRAIQQAFEFHMQFYENGEDKGKLQSLLIQVLENLKLTNNDIDETPIRRDHLSTLLSRPNTPPEKEATANDLSSQAEALVTEDQIDLPSANQTTEELSSSKSSPRHTFRIPET